MPSADDSIRPTGNPPRPPKVLRWRAGLLDALVNCQCPRCHNRHTDWIDSSDPPRIAMTIQRVRYYTVYCADCWREALYGLRQSGESHA